MSVQEGKSNCIEVTIVDAQIVEKMVAFLYRGDYDADDRDSDDHAQGHHDAKTRVLPCRGFRIVPGLLEPSGRLNRHSPLHQSSRG